MPGTWEELEGRREYLRRTAENSTRHAYAYARMHTTGWGEFVFEDCFEFGLTFIEKPYLSYGATLDEEGPDLVDTRFPRSWGQVYKWRRDNNGNYVGAWLMVVVETQSSNIATSQVEPKYWLDHCYTFHGLATKYMPDYQAEQDLQ